MVRAVHSDITMLTVGLVTVHYSYTVHGDRGPLIPVYVVTPVSMLTTVSTVIPEFMVKPESTVTRLYNDIAVHIEWSPLEYQILHNVL